MKNLIRTGVILSIAVIITMITSADCFAQKKAKKQKTKAGKETAPAAYNLAYKIPEGKSLSYFGKTAMYMTVDANGQTMNVNVDVILSCTSTGKGMEKGNLKLEVRIDTMSQSTDTPQGSMGGLISDVSGKSFNMLLSPTGKEVDIKDAEKIVFSTEGVESNVGQSFIDYFPDIPAKPVKPGDTWPTDDTINSKSSTTVLKQITHAENTFAGIETIDGIQCAKITSVLSGTRETMAQTMGMDITQLFKFTGTSELYFAIKEGYYLKQVANSKLTGTMEIGGAQNMTMPVAGDMVSVSRLKK